MNNHLKRICCWWWWWPKSLLCNSTKAVQIPHDKYLNAYIFKGGNIFLYTSRRNKQNTYYYLWMCLRSSCHVPASRRAVNTTALRYVSVSFPSFFTFCPKCFGADCHPKSVNQLQCFFITSLCPWTAIWAQSRAARRYVKHNAPFAEESEMDKPPMTQVSTEQCELLKLKPTALIMRSLVKPTATSTFIFT